MTIHHHPSEATLVAYAAGALNEGLSLVVAAHLSQCPRCRRDLELAEEMGGITLDSLPATDIGQGLLDTLLARIPDIPQDSPADPAPPRIPPPDVPAPLTDYLPGDLASVPWRTLAPGVRHHALPMRHPESGTLRLLRIAPGTAVPHHGHRGSELTLVLRGSFCDELGRFRSGDLADLDADREHQPVADTDQDCICLIAADAPLRFTGLLPRLVQPFVGV